VKQTALFNQIVLWRRFPRGKRLLGAGCAVCGKSNKSRRTRTRQAWRSNVIGGDAAASPSLLSPSLLRCIWKPAAATAANEMSSSRNGEALVNGGDVSARATSAAV
jgi:hypothetical protein